MIGDKSASFLGNATARRLTSSLCNMIERASVWRPVPDIEDGFGSISFSYESNRSRDALIVMNGKRQLILKFSRVIAFQFEDDCPGNFALPPEMPRLNTQWVFPLLEIENSRWLNQWPMWPNLKHFVLFSLEDLVQLIALPTVDARWR
jgi:hypothetical protein